MDKRFEIVDAASEDMDWIRDLAESASIFTFSGIRSTPRQRAKYMLEEFEELKGYVRRGLYRFLLAKDTEKNLRAGYLCLNLYDQDDLGRRQTFVEDIAAPPEYWGLGIGHLLFDAATKVTAELGIDFMGGEVAAENSRIEAALRNNFILETYRVVRPCTPNAHKILQDVQANKQRDQGTQKKVDKLRKRREARKAKKSSSP